MPFLSTLLSSVLLTIVLIPVGQALALRWRVVDLPGERKIHDRPIARVGGVAMAVGAAVPVVYWFFGDPFVLSWLVGAGIVLLFGIADDFKGLRPRWKCAGQLLAALVVIVFGKVQIRTLGVLLPDEVFLPSWIAVPFTAFVIVGVTNAVNLADGLDGLAGGLCLLIFCCIGYLASLEGDTTIGFVALAMAGAIFGFLRYNTHPASVFMGDAGSQLLGFTAVTLSLALTQGNTALSPVLPLLLLGFPVLDTLAVMAVRAKKRRSLFEADRNHFHHNLMALGLQQGESVVVIYVCQTVLIAAAFLLRFHSEWLLLGGYLAFSTATILFFTVASRNGIHPSVNGVPISDYFGSRLLRKVKVEGTAIRIVFPALQFGLPLFFFVSCLLPSRLPPYIPFVALGFLALIAAVRFLKREWEGDVLRLTVYLLVPIVVYEGTHAPSAWALGWPLRAYHVLFPVLAFLDIAVSKLSRRREGFKTTPLDFLLVILALAVAGLSLRSVQAYDLASAAGKILIFYISYEVLMAEARSPSDGVVLATAAALLAMAAKWLI
jgi:UDP-GlcNAc:undecaprenyl-phosphate GlcNAc-1-phosphate transferase